jgi:cytidylate kinase
MLPNLRIHPTPPLVDMPLHGNQGDRDLGPLSEGPEGLSIAISREVGSRGGSIARRLAKKLGWQVYSQEHLEFLCANETLRAQVLLDVPRGAATWAQQQLDRLQENQGFDPSELGPMPELILTLAARGRVILVGRGAGYLLPRETTLHIRVVAPLEDRIGYMAQWLRLPQDEAAHQVQLREEKRAEFLLKHFNRKLSDLYEYDLILNSSQLGEDICAEVIVTVIQGRERQLRRESMDVI